MQNKKTYNFHINGMHCKSCVLLTESKLQEVPYVVCAKCSLDDRKAEVTGDFGDKDLKEIAQDLSTVLIKHGYSLSIEPEKKDVKWSDFKIAVPITLAFFVVFFILQKIGLIDFVNSENISYDTAFLVGVIASLSTCMAVVGGVVLSMSATFAKEGDKVRPQLLFHIGRIISFFVLGGVIGSIGSVFQISSFSNFILGLIVGIVMLILGINLLDVFHWAKKFQPSMPKFFSKNALDVTNLNHTLTPLIIGVATFFLPCGFTQSMQIYTLSTGSFLKGGLTMLSFALGTLPILALISFSSFSIHDKKGAGIFFKTAGLIVIIFALFNIINSFAAIGIIPPLFNF